MQESLALEIERIRDVVFGRIEAQLVGAAEDRREGLERILRLDLGPYMRAKHDPLLVRMSEPLPILVIGLQVARAVQRTKDPVVAPGIARKDLVATGARQTNLHECGRQS